MVSTEYREVFRVWVINKGRITSHTPLSRTLPLHLLMLIFREPFPLDYRNINHLPYNLKYKGG